MLKIQVHDGCSILMSWKGAKGCAGVGILSAPAVPACAHPSFPSLHPAVPSHNQITVGPVRQVKVRKRNRSSCLVSTREAKPGGGRETDRHGSERVGAGGHHDGTFMGWRLGQGGLPVGGLSKELRNNGRRGVAEKWRALQKAA